VLPVLELRQQAPAADSWDALLTVDDRALAVAVAGGGRLLQLRCLHWPNIPHRLAQYCRTTCPKVAVNPSPEQVADLQLPRTCDPLLQFDAALLTGACMRTMSGRLGCCGRCWLAVHRVEWRAA
jgi:hypothetical protein